MCNNPDNIIVQADFSCIGDVAKHCVTDKLCIAIFEAQEYDLSELFCDFWPDIVEIAKEVQEYETDYAAYLIDLAECEADPDCETPPIEPIEPVNYAEKRNLICGGSFEGCNGKTKTHLGIKNILVNYAYSRYVILNGFSDTASGNVKKTNEFSLPTPMKELQAFADSYRTKGYLSYKKTLDFLCKNKDVFTDFTYDDCGDCGCGGKCNGKTKAKGYGFKGSNIIKTNYHNDNHPRIPNRYIDGL